MPGNSPLYYWDTCLFLAWLKDVERNLGEMDGVRETIDRCRRREVKTMHLNRGEHRGHRGADSGRHGHALRGADEA
jgi:hypothetical protein